jgi:hypothetical protein
MFPKIENTFLWIRSWGRRESVLQIVEPGEFMNMDRFLFIELVPEGILHSSEDNLLVRITTTNNKSVAFV